MMSKQAKSFPVNSKNLFNRFNLFISLPYFRRKGYIRVDYIDNSKDVHRYVAPWAGPGKQIRIDGVGPNDGMTFTPDVNHAVYEGGMLKFVIRGNDPVSVDLNVNGHNNGSHLDEMKAAVPYVAERFLDAFNLTKNEAFLADSQRFTEFGIALSKERSPLLTADVIDDAMAVSHAATLRAARAGKLFGGRAGFVLTFGILLGILMIIVIGLPVIKETLG